MNKLQVPPVHIDEHSLKELFEYYKKDTLFIEKQKQWGVDDTFMLENITLLQYYVDNRKKMEHEYGYYEDLVYEDGELLFRITKTTQKKQDEKLRQHIKNYDIYPIPRQVELLSFESIITTSTNPNMLKRVLLEFKKALDNKRGLFVYGVNGTGKTYFMYALGNYFTKQDKKVLFVRVSELISDLRGFVDDFGIKRSRILDACYHSDVVILDDIGSENITRFTRDQILNEILSYRNEHNKLTYFTSNYDLETLEKKYELNSSTNDKIDSKRIISRIKALTKVVELNGNDYRTNKIE